MFQQLLHKVYNLFEEHSYYLWQRIAMEITLYFSADGLYLHLLPVLRYSAFSFLLLNLDSL